jgi:hypothetical protein
LLDEPDMTFRNGLANGLKRPITRFLDRGGILIVFTRLPLKNFECSQHHVLANGSLRQMPIDRSAEGKVVSFQNAEAR